VYFILWTLALGFVACAAWTDWRSRRIPNKLTMPGMLVGLAANTILSAVFGPHQSAHAALVSGWAGTKGSLAGFGIGLVVLLPFVLLRALGAGDWKLMAALGAILRASNIILLLLGTVFVAGLMAAVEVVRRGRIKETLVNMATLVLAFLTFGVRPSKVNLDNPGLMTIPFGVAAALAAVLLFCAESAYRVL
jgi:prepilin peptidase CpaA